MSKTKPQLSEMQVIQLTWCDFISPLFVLDITHMNAMPDIKRKPPLPSIIWAVIIKNSKLTLTQITGKAMARVMCDYIAIHISVWVNWENAIFMRLLAINCVNYK